MDPLRRQSVLDSLAAAEERAGQTYPLTSALARSLGGTPVTYTLFDRYYRIISAVHPQPGLLMAAIHHLALSGQAEALAEFFPTCGGQFSPQQEARLQAAVQQALAENQEDVLDFLLTYQPQAPEARRILAVALGTAAVSSMFGGGVSLFELGGGLHLYPDKFQYQLGHLTVGTAGPLLEATVDRQGGLASLLVPGLPPVVGRMALDLGRQELNEPLNRQVQLSFIWPDQPERAGRLRAAHEVLAANAPVPARYGDVHFDLLPALTAAYEAMAPGNTFLMLNVLTWTYLSEEERIAVASCVQRLGQRLAPHKPVAWLQVEPLVGAGGLELKLNTYGWADQEDRTVRRLGLGAVDLGHLSWLE